MDLLLGLKWWKKDSMIFFLYDRAGQELLRLYVVCGYTPDSWILIFGNIWVVLYVEEKCIHIDNKQTLINHTSIHLLSIFREFSPSIIFRSFTIPLLGNSFSWLSYLSFLVFSLIWWSIASKSFLRKILRRLIFLGLVCWKMSTLCSFP